jgi:hypothetical protein
MQPTTAKPSIRRPECGMLDAVTRQLALAATLAAAVVAATALGSPAPARASLPFSDIADSPFVGDIVWLAGEGITGGCGDGRFCPTRVVTREQMASFLARLLDLPSDGSDHFADDESSRHEGDINRLAAAGITGGCGQSRFCPRQAVTREQMASFLVRAGRLPVDGRDYFLDDERTAHGGDINRLAAAGITSGCDRARFCPTRSVTRAEMAAFLRRLATGGGSAPPALPNAAPMPACSYQDLPTKHSGYDDWARTLLDPIHMVPSTYVPPGLVDTGGAGINGGYRLRSLAIADLRAMAADAARAGVTIRVYSTYRSYAAQVASFDMWVSRLGYEEALRRSARPGHSEHQLGTTIDVVQTPGTWSWLATNAWRYGWVMSYPRGEIGRVCYIHEPWHYRYLGREATALIRAAGITPREYLWRMQ